MFTRKVVTASAAALALVALSVPVVNAQDDGPGAGEAGTGSLSLGSLEGGSLDAGSLTGGSDATDDASDGDEGGTGGDESADTGSLGGGSLGSLDAAGGDGASLGGMTPETDEVCELPGLGGSVAKFYPLFGIDGVPTGVLDLISSALDSYPNLLDMVAGEGRGSALVGEAGSLSEGLCTLVFGGELVPPPVTVIVDGEGTPVTTITGTPASSADASPSAGSTAASGETGSGNSEGASGTTSGTTSVDADSDDSDMGDSDAGERVLATSVPVPGA